MNDTPSNAIAGVLSFAIAIAIIAISWSSFVPAKQPAKPHGKVTVRLKWLHQAQFAGFYTAKEKDFYKANNIDKRSGFSSSSR